ncbi:MAG: rhodanese-like domain-containing protein [Muricomes sp.]
MNLKDEKIGNEFFIYMDEFKKIVYGQNENCVILDMPYGKFEYVKEVDNDKRKYEDCHIPGAIKIEKEEFENEESDLNILSAEIIEKVFLKKGIDADTDVYVYSDGIIAAARVALVAYWLGVRSVKLLVGGINAWIKDGNLTENGVVEPKEKSRFGIKTPLRPEILVSTPQDVMERYQENPDFVLASVRTWEEFTGDESGYDYIDNIGSPIGAVFAKGSTSRINVEYLLNDEGVVGDLKEIFEDWNSWGIQKEKEVAFFCGAGWRAALAFFLTKELGWPNVKVYDGGWYQWVKYHHSEPEKYPIQKGNPKEKENL